MSTEEEKKLQNPLYGKAPPVPKFNDLFKSYYKQIYVPGTLSEEEFDQMLEAFKKQLPIVFKVIKTGAEAEKIHEELDKHISFLKENGVVCEKLDYIPNNIGDIYRINLDKRALKHDDKFEDFHKWLKIHTALGHCSRQEFVSMVPPYFLDVHGSMGVLDTCAAPGSKTAQLIEMLSGDGYVVANDMDKRRISPMIHQLQRVGTSRTLVVNFEGQKLPDFGVKFDRVLCDVPCTCDGTVRKSIKVAERFRLEGGSELHYVQRKVLRRGLELTKVGGLCVYSTCSMNPIEDEAVVNATLLQLDGSVEIVDVSDKFPDLKRHKGLKYWPVLDTKDGKIIEYKDASEVPQNRQQTCNASFFPQPQVEGLEHCMHFFPQDQDSGGFFVTVLRKVKEFEPLNEKISEKKPLREAPYVPINEQAPEVFSSIKEQFGFDESFPEDCVFVRNDDSTKNITYVVRPLANIIREKGSANLRAVKLGTNMFTWKHYGKDKEYCAYPTIDGIMDTLKFAKKRVFYFSPKDMFVMLHYYPKAVAFSQLSEDARKQFEGMGKSGAVLCTKDKNFAYGGLSFEKSCVIYIRKDIAKYELDKIKMAYPELIEYEKELNALDAKNKEEAEAKKESAEVEGDN